MNTRVLILFVGLLLLVVAACSDNGTDPTGGEDWLAPLAQSVAHHSPDVLYAVNSGDDGLSIVEPETGTVTFVGPLDSDEFSTPVAMAVHPENYGIYVWNNSPNAGLATIDPCTGLAAFVGEHSPDGPGLQGLAFDAAGDLYGADSSLLAVDPSTGATTLIGPLGNGLRAGGADFGPDGVLYVVDLVTSPPQRLATVDTGTGAATVVAELSEDIGTIGSIVFAPDGTLLGSSFGGPLGRILFAIDPADGTVSDVRSLEPRTALQGLGFAPACGFVQIDIKPGSDVNPINLGSNGVIPVAVLGTVHFDVHDIDDSTLRFGPAGAPIAHKKAHVGDVNDDGIPDLVAHFRTQETGIAPDATEACLTGLTFSGVELSGCDCIRIVPRTGGSMIADSD